jgi:electron transfer flavoprotein beta subunit
MKIVALLSAGRTGTLGRARRADLDARAVELALRLGGRVTGLHAGRVDEPMLRSYLGMGLEAVEVAPVDPEEDACGPLQMRLAALRPDLVVAGAMGEVGAASGFLPYRLASDLGLPLLSEVAALRAEAGKLFGEQRLGRGQVRDVAVSLPAFATASAAAPSPRQSAPGRARSGVIRPLPVSETPAASGRREVVTADPEVLGPARRPRRALDIRRLTLGEVAGAPEGPQAGAVTDPKEAARLLLKILRDRNFIPERPR